MRPARRGFSLVELLVVLAGTAVLAQAFYGWKRAVEAEAVVDRAVESFEALEQAVYAFRIDNPGPPPAWPANVDPGLAAYVGAGQAAGLAARGFALTPAGDSLRIAVDMPTEEGAEAVARAFPATAVVGAANARGYWPVTVTVSVPGFEAERDSLLPHDGTRPMLGDLLLDGNDVDLDGGTIDTAGGDIDMGGGEIDLGGGDIVGVGTAEADIFVFTAAVTAGGTCPAGGVGVDATGLLMTCQGGAWTGARVCNVLAPAPGGAPTPGFTRAERAGHDHWLILVTMCGELPGIQFEGSNA